MKFSIEPRSSLSPTQPPGPRCHRPITLGALAAGLLLALGPALEAQPQPYLAPSAPASVPGEWTVTERGPHHAVHERIEVLDLGGGRTERIPHRYVELASGMYYRDNGQWLPSQELIETHPGGAVAQRGPHKVIFSPNVLDPWCLDIESPDGQRLRAQALGLTCTDAAGRSVVIAELRDTEGLILGNNRVIYPDCFDGIAADLRYTYTQAGFEQDVILRGPLPHPADFGLDPNSTKLQVMTEFLVEQQPRKTVRESGGMRDEILDFGTLYLQPGRAFSLESPQHKQTRVTVSKRWEVIDGRSLLIEEVDWPALSRAIQSVPRLRGACTPNTNLNSIASTLFRIPDIDRRARPARPLAFAAAAPDQPGYVLDWRLALSTNHLVLAADTTYYVSGEVNVTGSLTIEGGTVVKYDNTNYCHLFLDAGTFDCQTGPYRPATFTSMHDNSIGETIPGSSGNPVADTQNYLLVFNDVDVDIHDLHLSYGYDPLTTYYGSLKLYDSQFTRNRWPIYVVGSSPVTLGNVLIDATSDDALYLQDADVTAAHLTVHDCYNLLWNASWPWTSSLSLTNSLLVNVDYLNVGNDTTLTTNTVIHTTGTNLFQTVGAGCFYLPTNSPWRNAAVNLGMDFSRKTTCPPVHTTLGITNDTTISPVVPRDTDTPDIGYHYPVIDYLPDNWTLTNATLTIDPDVVLATMYTNYGLWLQGNCTLNALGTPTDPIWLTRYNAVQEQPELLGSRSNDGLPLNPWNSNPATRANATLRFVNWSAPANSGYTIYHNDAWSFKNLTLDSCALYNGGSRYILGGTNSTALFRNTLFHRGGISAQMSSLVASLCLSNCLFEGVSTVMLHDPTLTKTKVFNNVFDHTTFSFLKTCSNGFNAYLNCNTNLLPADANSYSSTNAIAWQSGPLGDYYQPTNSPLINTGSVTAAAAGLYHFTTQTNQTKEGTSTVDIGLHYVALDGSGLPLDTDGDGLPDYIEDANGNGSYEAGDLADWQAADTDGDGLNDSLEVALGTTPHQANPVEATEGALGLRIFTPLQ